jgi:hypothetical protein
MRRLHSGTVSSVLVTANLIVLQFVAKLSDFPWKSLANSTAMPPAFVSKLPQGRLISSGIVNEKSRKPFVLWLLNQERAISLLRSH